MATPRPEITDIVARYCAQLTALGIRVERVILFGSHARGEAGDGSDIDLLIVSSDFATLNTRERLEQLGTAAARLWQPIEAIACTPAELVHVEPATLLEEIVQTGVQVEEVAMAGQHVPITVEEVTDPEELARARAQDECFARNSAWLQAHATEIYTQYRGKCICVAGEELFIADTPEEALAQARTAHPEEGGSILIRYIPRDKAARIYAY